MPDLPNGTVTLLFIEVAESTALLQQLGDYYTDLLQEWQHLLHEIVIEHNGHEVNVQGDTLLVAFGRATDAIVAAVAIEHALAHHCWPEGISVQVRMGLHTGEPQLVSGTYIGPDVHHAARIMSAAHAGQILLSQTTRDLVELLLQADTSLRDLGEYRLKDLQRPSRLFQLVCPDLPADFPPLKTLDDHPNNLPVQPTLLIGREQEIAQACQLLRRSEVRLLTLTGPGGVGKTRLALQVAAELGDLFPDGVFLVALAPLSDPQLVVPTIAQTLEIPELSYQLPLTTLMTALKEKHLLLLLDNFEQVAVAASQLAELLTACPKVKLLVTSRVGLHLRAEHEFAVPPLAAPALKQRLPDLVTLSQYEAVRLFIERAQAVKPDFQVTNANAPAVAEICVRLDGLPLAIELAAARSKAFPPQTLLARLKQGLAVLATQVRDLPPRQQTLRSTISWSYNLLPLEEQQLFRRLAVFVDGCTCQAVEQVCTAASTLEGDILEILASLVDKSLLQQREQVDGEPRFWMLQTLREYGLERLATEGEIETTRRAHAAYYLTQVEEAEPHLRGTEQGKWLSWLEWEHENLRASLTFLLGRALEGIEQAEQALRICSALFWFWYICGYVREGRAFLEQALVSSEGVGTRPRAKALFVAGHLAFAQDDYEQVEAYLEESLALFRDLGDTRGIATSLRVLGSAAWTRSQYARASALLEEAALLYRQVGDRVAPADYLTELAHVCCSKGEYDRARSLLEEGLALARALSDQGRTGWMLYHLARLHFEAEGDLDKARSLAEEGLALWRQVGHTWGIGNLLNLLAEIALRQGEEARAYALAEESVALLKERGDRWATVQALLGFMRVLTAQGIFEMARRLSEESLAILREIGSKEFLAACLEILGEVVAAQEEPLWAVRLWGSAHRLRAEIGAVQPPIYRTNYERALAAVRRDLGEQVFATAWAHGQAMTPDQALTTREVALPPLEVNSVPPARQPSPAPVRLTRRELEVLHLLTEGYTNPQIAERLVVSLPTVNTHVTSIFNKLGVNSRSAATRYAVQHHLL